MSYVIWHDPFQHECEIKIHKKAMLILVCSLMFSEFFRIFTGLWVDSHAVDLTPLLFAHRDKKHQQVLRPQALQALLGPSLSVVFWLFLLTDCETCGTET